MQKVSIEYLVRNGADTAARNNKYFTPLILAIDLSYVGIVEVKDYQHPLQLYDAYWPV